MRTELAFVGARGVDSLPYSQGGTAAQAQALAAAGIEFFVGYLGAMNTARLGYLLDAGLAFMPVTFADRFDGVAAVAQCKALGLTPGCTVWLDIEGKNLLNVPSQQVAAQINAWATAVEGAGYQPGLYVGSPQPFTGDELYSLKVKRYWKAPSRVIDRNGKVWDGPGCGFCCYQLWDSVMWKKTGVFVDVDYVQKDFQGRLPSWTVK